MKGDRLVRTWHQCHCLSTVQVQSRRRFKMDIRYRAVGLQSWSKDKKHGTDTRLRVKRKMIHNIYRPPTKLREGNVFTGVCHSVHREVCLIPGPFRGVWGWVYLEGTPPSKGTPCKGTPPGRYFPSPRNVHPHCWHLVVVTEAGGKHPTGMLSCIHCFLTK